MTFQQLVADIASRFPRAVVTVAFQAGLAPRWEARGPLLLVA